ncbi:P-type conjugative transfer protein TrbG [Caulobacter endophyticus]|uniref:P-type conjugative transfer protein TrbG n=1 Tax=Caulobacter endophyticus TaxID=2172652 RepID=A0A2T9JI36_9CAUL|nr:P-type conjugative transfer protein TrbG [Caulobacter endophyticus]PVM83361.1 P-type conjugative transfer protein TrbG [Caulobacter endophyticus]
MNRLLFAVTLAGLGSMTGAGAQAVEPADARLGAPAGLARFDYAEGGVYPVVATPGRITDIVLEPGEALVETGAIAAGDTARWVIGDTTSGSGAARVVHVLIKPVSAGLATNLVINTDRRTYHLELRASARTWQTQVSWRYRPAPLVLVAAPPAAPAESAANALDLARVDRRYRILGDRPSWRPVAVFDDGQRVYVEFGPRVTLSDLPPLYRAAPDGASAELINYHVEGRRLITERLFDRAELRLGAKRRAQKVVIVREAALAGAAR